MNKQYTKNEYFEQWINSHKDENGEIDHLAMLAQLHAAVEQFELHGCESSKQILFYGSSFVGNYLQDLYNETSITEEELFDRG